MRLTLACTIAILAALCACGSVSDPNADNDAGQIDATFVPPTDCVDGCLPAADCVIDEEIGAHCVCRPGFEGDGVETCDDIDECEAGGADECVEGASCVNLPGTFRCACEPGSVGDGRERCRSGLIFLAGAGTSPDNNQRFFKSFDIDTWEFADEALMPVDNNDMCEYCTGTYGPVAAHGSLFFFRDSGQRYDDNWAPSLYPLTRRFTYSGTVAVGERIFRVGRNLGYAGIDAAAGGGYVDFYDARERRWSAPDEVSRYRWVVSHPALAVVGDKLYAIAGARPNPSNDPNITNDRFGVLDLTNPTKAWDPIFILPPFEADEPVAHVIGPLIYVQPRHFGQDYLFIFDTDNMGWIDQIPVPLPHPDGPNQLRWKSVVVHERLFIVGSVYSPDSQSMNVEIREWLFGQPQPYWSTIAVLPGHWMGSNDGFVASSD